MTDNKFSVFGFVPGLQETRLPGEQQAADYKAQQAAAKAAQETPANQPTRQQPLVAGAPVQQQTAAPPASIAAGYASWAPANMSLVDVEYRNNFPQEA